MFSKKCKYKFDWVKHGILPAVPVINIMWQKNILDEKYLIYRDPHEFEMF